jgi:prephenate dehydrogenase
VTRPHTLRAAHIAIAGLGLMGASLGYDLRGHCRRVTGIVRRSEAIGPALAAGCVDDATLDAPAALAEADIVVLAAPVRAILHQIAVFGPLLKPGAILIDLGSTKTDICRALAALPPHVQAIGGHPMCGKETGGLSAAEPGLYRGCTFVLCPLDRTSAEAQAVVAEMVAFIGARALVLDPARHDRLVAAISHLPYLAACALVDYVSDVAMTDPIVWEVAAGGFRDSSRVAASDVDMLIDILLTNRAAVLASVDRYVERLTGLRAGLAVGDEAGLRAALAAIANERRQWGRGRTL